MQYGSLGRHFIGIAAKRLSAVEADRARSHQHEFNGTAALRQLLGGERIATDAATFLYLGAETETLADTARATWYDARENHPTRTEWRLYFADNAVMVAAGPGDLLIVARRPSGELLFIVTRCRSTVENQIAYLFGLDGELSNAFRFSEFSGSGDRGLDFVSALVLEELGIEPEPADADRVDAIVAGFEFFPASREFSALARASLPRVEPRDDPDGALIAWVEFEEAMFRCLERRLVAARLRTGFTPNGSVDVDGFLQFSLSVQNRRKSRMGLSLENHVEAVLIALGVRYARGAATEGNARPDFVFPGAAEYADKAFDSSFLSMLGVKSTLKDRWRQVLAEAGRIRVKHLLTLETAISTPQTDEMRRNGVQLVVPAELRRTFTADQAAWLLSFGDFISIVRDRQRRSGL